MKKRLNYPLIIVLALTIMGGALQAYIPSRYYVSGLMTYWLKTDTSLSVNVDTANSITRHYIQRLADSVAANRSGTTTRDFVVQLFFATFNNATNDSTNLGVPGIYFHLYPHPVALYLDRFMLNTNIPSLAGPSTFRNDLPTVSNDSGFIFRVSRNNSFPAGQKAAITAYKVANGTGFSFANTAGVFYDMIRFDEAYLGAAGSSRQVYVSVSFRRNR